MPSGTMGNIVSLAAHCQRGEEVILGDASHINLWEAGAPSALLGLVMRTLRNNVDGTLDLAGVFSL